MPLSMTDTCERVATVIEGIGGELNVYRPSTDGRKRIPDAVAATPAVLVLPGETIKYVLQGGHQSHDYYLRVLFLNGGGDLGFASANGLPYLDRLIAAFEFQVTLTGRATSCVFERQTGFSTIEWGGGSYPGWEIFLAVNEQASAAPKPGDV